MVLTKENIAELCNIEATVELVNPSVKPAELVMVFCNDCFYVYDSSYEDKAVVTFKDFLPKQVDFGPYHLVSISVPKELYSRARLARLRSFFKG